MPNYDSTSRTPFAKGGRAELFSGGTGKKRDFTPYYTGPPRKGDKKKKKKKKKEDKPYTKSKRVSRETIHEAIDDVDFYNKKPKVHTTEEGRKAAFDRVNKIIKKQGRLNFPTEKALKKIHPERDKGWKKKKKVEQN